MNRLIHVSAQHPLPTLLISLLLTVVAASMLPSLRIQIGADGLAIEDHADMRWLRHVQRVYGKGGDIVVFVSDKNLFRPESLRAIREVSDGLQSMPEIETVVSIATAKRVKVVDDEIRFSRYLDVPPNTRADAEAVLADILANPLISGSLVAPDGQATVMLASLVSEPIGDVSDAEIVRRIDKLLQPLESVADQVFQLGEPYVRGRVFEKIRHDQTHVVPLAMGVLLLVLAIGFRRWKSAIIPAVTAAISIVWTVGLMAATGVPLTIMTSIIPVLLIIIGSTEDIHLLSDYLHLSRAGVKKRPAIGRMGRRMSLPITLTFCTTYVGFLSISIQDISVLREFGIFASTGLAFNFLVTVTVLPALLSIAPEERPQDRRHRLADFVIRTMLATSRIVRRHIKASGLVIVVVCLVSGWGAMRLGVKNNTLDYFPPGSELKQRISTAGRGMHGLSAFSIVLNSEIEGTFAKIRYLSEVAKMQEFLRRTGQFGTTSSFATLLGYVHQLMQEYPPGTLDLPESDELVAEYLLFLEPEELSEYVNQELSETRIVVRHSIHNSDVLMKAVEKIYAFARTDIDSGLHVHVTGPEIVNARAADAMAAGQAISILIMTLVIGLVIALMFFNLKAGVVGIVPNLFPIVVLFGVMGFAGIAVDTATSMVGAIALGICVDDTMHFMARYQQHSKTEPTHEFALEKTIADESLPIVATSVALGMGFCTMVFSEFPPVRNFGLLSAMVMGLALISTFVITPVLLSSIRLIGIWELLGLRVRNAVMRNCPLFHGMRLWQVKKLILASRVVECIDGETIIHQGEPGDAMFVILQGHARVSRLTESGQIQDLRLFQTGDVFGEMALLTQSLRSANVIAMGDTRVLVLSWRGIRRIAKLFPHVTSRFFMNMSAVLSKRLTEDLHNGGADGAGRESPSD